MAPKGQRRSASLCLPRLGTIREEIPSQTAWLPVPARPGALSSASGSPPLCDIGDGTGLLEVLGEMMSTEGLALSTGPSQAPMCRSPQGSLKTPQPYPRESRVSPGTPL